MQQATRKQSQTGRAALQTAELAAGSVSRKDHPICYALGQRPFDNKKALVKAQDHAQQAKKDYEAWVKSPEVKAKTEAWAKEHNDETRQRQQELPMLLLYKQLEAQKEQIYASK